MTTEEKKSQENNLSKSINKCNEIKSAYQLELPKQTSTRQYCCFDSKLLKLLFSFLQSLRLWPMCRQFHVPQELGYYQSNEASACFFIFFVLVHRPEAFKYLLIWRMSAKNKNKNHFYLILRFASLFLLHNSDANFETVRLFVLNELLRKCLLNISEDFLFFCSEFLFHFFVLFSERKTISQWLSDSICQIDWIWLSKSKVISLIGARQLFLYFLFA